MNQQIQSQIEPTPTPSDDIAALYRIYGAMDIDYVNIVQIAHVNRAFERWPLLAECAQQVKRRG